MAQIYLPFLGNDGNYYIRRRVDPGGTETVLGPFATLALLQAQFKTSIFTDTTWSEIAS